MDTPARTGPSSLAGANPLATDVWHTALLLGGTLGLFSFVAAVLLMLTNGLGG